MNEQILKMNGLSLQILDSLSYESQLDLSLKKNLHYFNKNMLISELIDMTECEEALKNVLSNCERSGIARMSCFQDDTR